MAAASSMEEGEEAHEKEPDDVRVRLTPQRIPRIIHQTMEPPTVDDLPIHMRRAVHKWKRLNPEYEHRYAGNESRAAYVRREGGRFRGLVEAYDQALSGAARADLWRLLVLFVNGGVYVDVDVVALRPLREVVSESDQALSAVSYNPSQTVMLYAPGHRFLALVIEHAVSRYASGYRRAQQTAGNAVHGEMARAFYCGFADHDTAPAGRYWDVDGAHSLRVVSDVDGHALGGLYNANRPSYAAYRSELKQMGIPHWGEIEVRLVSSGVRLRPPRELGRQQNVSRGGAIAMKAACSAQHVKAASRAAASAPVLDAYSQAMLCKLSCGCGLLTLLLLCWRARLGRRRRRKPPPAARDV
mmetsp:Transcript_23149/g.57186  ORF Transcript_23149/g.57186 Transcript_23149/m.57186 type:complete len:356 (-) Transcript_23149:173-1240(-)